METSSVDITNDILEKAKKWLTSAYDDETKKKVEHLIKSDQKELVESFYRDLEFGTGGLRGIMGVGSNRINEYTIGMATQGLCNYTNKIQQGKLSAAIAYDSRNKSSFFAKKTAEIFAANGIDTYLFKELRPTPLLSFAIRHYNCSCGIVITASHNPKEYNGYKVYWNDGGQLVPPHDKGIIDEVRAIKSMDEVKKGNGSGRIISVDKEVDEIYLEELSKLIQSPKSIQQQKNTSIVYTSLHGTGITLIPDALKKVGFTNISVVEAQKIPDGNFPTVKSPNPEEREALSMALEKAKEIDADLILGTDPDTDRVGAGIKDNDGNYTLLNGNQVAALLVYYELKKLSDQNLLKGNEYIVKTIVTSPLLSKIADFFNVKCYDTLTGFKYIAEKIRLLEGKEKFICGGEESYGYLVGDFVRDKDAVISSVVIAEILAWAKDNGYSLNDILTDIYQQFGLYHESLVSVVKKGKEGDEAIKKMMHDLRNNLPKELCGSKVSRVLDYDSCEEKDLINNTTIAIPLPKSNVLQIVLQDETIISVRPSGTEPKIKFYFGVKGILKNKNDYPTERVKLENKLNDLKKALNL